MNAISPDATVVAMLTPNNQPNKEPTNQPTKKLTKGVVRKRSTSLA
jgi:hypothetical protein